MRVGRGRHEAECIAAFDEGFRGFEGIRLIPALESSPVVASGREVRSMNHAAAARFLLAVCFLVMFFNGGARFAIGLLLHPMAHDLQWSRSTLSLNVTVFMVLSACALPLVGRLVDRFGAGAVLGTAVLVSALGPRRHELHGTAVGGASLLCVVFALGSAGTSVTPIGVLLSRWYPHRMGMANSIAISGMGVGQLLVIAVLAAQLTTFGWRGSFLALGVATLVCVLPLVVAAGRSERPAPASARSPALPCLPRPAGGREPFARPSPRIGSDSCSSSTRSAVSRTSSSPPTSWPSPSTKGWIAFSPATCSRSWGSPASAGCCSRGC